MAKHRPGHALSAAARAVVHRLRLMGFTALYHGRTRDRVATLRHRTYTKIVIAAALALTVAAQASPMPAHWNGVWATQQGQVVVINSTSSLQLMLGERHLAAYGIKQVPDGTYLGTWQGNRRMELKDRRVVRDTLSLESAYGPYPSGAFLPIPQKPATAADYGDVRIAEGKVDSYGRMLNLAVLLRDANGAKKIDAAVFPVATLEGLSVAGSFADSTLALDLRDGGGRSSALDGTLAYGGVTYPLKGLRVEARARFSLTHPNTGRDGGWGYVEWAPSPRRVAQMRNRDSNVTDQIVIFLYLADNSLPAGSERILPRK